MPTEWTLSVSTLFGFLLVLTRVGGALVFVPLPGIRAAVDPARAALTLAITLALYPRWPVVEAAMGAGRLLGLVLAEAALGIGIGVAAAMVIELFLVAAQTLGFQAGYGYASVIDPTSEADSSILLVFSQLGASLLFFALGLDRELVRLFASSLETSPPGMWLISRHSAELVVRLGQIMLVAGVRLALPIVALLLLVDTALALAGRINAQLQLLSLAFPAKMLAALVVLSWLLVLWPRLGGEVAHHAWQVMRQLARV
jgi:flagellar biosynthetic protein FliR